MRFFAYDIYQENHPDCHVSIIRMFDFARHEWIRIQKENFQTSLRTEINLFAAMVCAGIFGYIFYFPAAGSFEF
jgi:hypothetical protein